MSKAERDNVLRFSKEGVKKRRHRSVSGVRPSFGTATLAYHRS